MSDVRGAIHRALSAGRNLGQNIVDNALDYCYMSPYDLLDAVKTGNVAIARGVIANIRNPNRAGMMGANYRKTITEVAIETCPVPHLAAMLGVLLSHPKTRVTEMTLLAAVTHPDESILPMLLATDPHRIEFTSAVMGLAIQCHDMPKLQLLLQQSQAQQVINDEFPRRLLGDQTGWASALRIAIEQENVEAVSLLANAKVNPKKEASIVPGQNHLWLAQGRLERNPDNAKLQEIVVILKERVREIDDQRTMLRGASAPAADPETLIRAAMPTPDQLDEEQRKQLLRASDESGGTTG